MPYSEVSITGYNSNPPEDDGTQASSNEVSWAKHKTKIGDPLKTAIETTQTNISTIVTTLEANLYAPAGTLMLFQQTAAPTNWTKATTHNDKALRVVSGTASSGGSTSFTSVFTARTIATGNLPSHTHGAGTFAAASHDHTVSVNRRAFNTSGASDNARLSLGNDGGTTGTFNSFTVGSSGALAVSGTSASTGSGTAMDFAVQYVDLIIASKDS